MAGLKVADELIKAICDKIYPVGSIYLTVGDENPSTIFGGTWVLKAGSHYLVGYDSDNTWFNKAGTDTNSTTGDSGSWSTEGTAITINQMPSHSHTIRYWVRNGSGNSGTHYGPTYGSDGMEVSGTSWSELRMYNQNTGGGQAHNHHHVSPYYVVKVYQRTA